MAALAYVGVNTVSPASSPATIATVAVDVSVTNVAVVHIAKIISVLVNSGGAVTIGATNLSVPLQARLLAMISGKIKALPPAE